MKASLRRHAPQEIEGVGCGQISQPHGQRQRTRAISSGSLSFHFRGRRLMSRLVGVRGLIAAFAAAAIVMTAAGAQAQAPKGACVSKAGQGTAATENGAKFQAYEAVLQATDWGMWMAWMNSSQKIGEAPGYRVSNLKSRCKPGGLGSECVIQATLCK
jgi:hypothetical protein